MFGEDVLEALSDKLLILLDDKEKEQLKWCFFDWFKEEDEDGNNEQLSQYNLRLGELINISVDYYSDPAHLISLTVSDYHWDVLAEDIGIIRDLKNSFTNYFETIENEDDSNNELKEDGVFWSHKEKPLKLIIATEIPYMRRSEIESAAERYLELPFALPNLEQLIVDVLIALELFGFADEVSLIARGRMRAFIIGSAFLVLDSLASMVKLAIYTLFPAFIVSYALQSIIGESASGWISVVLVVLFLLGALLIIAVLPKMLYGLWGSISKSQLLLSEMLNVYCHMRLSGPVSSSLILKLVEKAALAGVVWPSLLPLLLERNIKNGGVL